MSREVWKGNVSLWIKDETEQLHLVNILFTNGRYTIEPSLFEYASNS